MIFDAVIVGGLVADGKGGQRIADVAISGDKIAAIGMLAEPRSATTIDASGCVVLPGFIDAHAHAEGILLGQGSVDAALLQGVTTFLLGQDGTSLAPALTREILDSLDQYWVAVNGRAPATLSTPFTVDDLLTALEGSPVNVAYLVPNGNVRLAVTGWSETALDATLLGRMRRLVRDGIEQGAVGVSSGLDYTPSRYATVDELGGMCRELARFGLPYVTHMRGYRRRAAAGIAEATQIARKAETPLHISHFSGTVDQVLPHLDSAEANSVDVTFDAYPFIASSTILAMAALPAALQVGTPEQTISFLRSRAGQEALRAHLASQTDRDFGCMILACADAASLRRFEGISLDDAANMEGLAVADLVVELLVGAGFGVTIIDPRPGAFTEEDIRTIARDRRHMVGSDGMYVGSHPHVRAYSTFAKYIGFAAIGRDSVGWGAVAEHTSGRAARRFQLGRRGVLEAGAYADVVVLRPEALAFTDDVREPLRHARGVEHVFVNGVHVVVDGSVVERGAGRSLRGPGAR